MRFTGEIRRPARVFVIHTSGALKYVEALLTAAFLPCTSDKVYSKNDRQDNGEHAPSRREASPCSSMDAVLLYLFTSEDKHCLSERLRV